MTVLKFVIGCAGESKKRGRTQKSSCDLQSHFSVHFYYSVVECRQMHPLPIASCHPVCHGHCTESPSLQDTNIPIEKTEDKVGERVAIWSAMVTVRSLHRVAFVTGHINTYLSRKTTKVGERRYLYAATGVFMTRKTLARDGGC